MLNITQTSYFHDGCVFIDGSGLSVTQECPMKANLVLLHRRKRRGEDAALRLGRHLHEALAYRNRMQGLGRPWTQDMQIRILTHRFTHSPCPNEDWRNLDLAEKVIHHYNEQFALEDLDIVKVNNKPVVEYAFAIDTEVTLFGWRVIYIGKLDALIRKPEGLFVFDYKSTSMLGETFWNEKAIDEAQRGYCWSVKKSIGTEPCGYIIRAIALRKPTRTGTSIEFETQRFFTAQPPGQLDEWFDNMISEVEVFLWHVSRNKFPMYHKSCITRYNKSCEFYEVCSARPDERLALLQGGGFEHNNWSPLVR